MSLSHLKKLGLILNELTVLPIITTESIQMFIDYSCNPLKFPKADEEDIELEEFKQVHVDLYHTPQIDIGI
jgi:hypothetical protein